MLCVDNGMLFVDNSTQALVLCLYFLPSFLPSFRPSFFFPSDNNNNNNNDDNGRLF